MCYKLGTWLTASTPVPRPYSYPYLIFPPPSGCCAARLFLSALKRALRVYTWLLVGWDWLGTVEARTKYTLEGSCMHKCGLQHVAYDDGLADLSGLYYTVVSRLFAPMTQHCTPSGPRYNNWETILSSASFLYLYIYLIPHA